MNDGSQEMHKYPIFNINDQGKFVLRPESANALHMVIQRRVEIVNNNISRRKALLLLAAGAATVGFSGVIHVATNGDFDRYPNERTSVSSRGQDGNRVVQLLDADRHLIVELPETEAQNLYGAALNQQKTLLAMVNIDSEGPAIRATTLRMYRFQPESGLGDLLWEYPGTFEEKFASSNVKFSPQGDLVAVEFWANLNEDKTVVIFDAKTGNELGGRTYSISKYKGIMWETMPQFTPDGQTLKIRSKGKMKGERKEERIFFPNEQFHD